ncbi:MAG: hypothetical protein KF833_20685 [Verrucomicrobiae bacterium]|nr:hypothetical protein [Verrucomicrobiae bacterium]
MDTPAAEVCRERDDRRLQSASGRGSIGLLLAVRRAVAVRASGGPGGGSVDRAVFCPEGVLLLTGSWDAYARVWDTRTGRLVGVPMLHNARVAEVAFHPSREMIATASSDGAARVWRVGGGEAGEIAAQHGGQTGVTAFSADGTLWLTVSRDGVVRAWDTQTWTPVTEPLRHRTEVRQAGFHPDGRTIWTWDALGVARRWPVPAYEPSDAAWLPDTAELLGRMYLDRANRFRVTSADRWNTIPPPGAHGIR